MRIAALALLAACGGSIPQTRYYQLAPAEGAAIAHPDGTVIAVSTLDAEGPYDDDRIVYRVDPVRLDYYAYHRWSSSPGAMLGTYLQDSLAKSGAFAAVLPEVTANTAIVVGGRVQAIEEVDIDHAHWVAHVAIVVTATDPRTSEVLWAQRYEQREPLRERTPEGLSRALGIAMQRIVREAAPAIAGIAEKQARAASGTRGPGRGPG